jgi:hypothetical protein
MQNNSNLLKYAVLTNNTGGAAYSTTNTGFQLTGATGATSLGIVTNEGPRNSTTGSLASFDSVSILVAAGTVLHLVANPQHITIVVENTGMTAVWETTSTDAHTFYNIPAFVQYSHYKSALTSRLPIIVPTTGSIVATQSWNATTFNVTNPNSGANFGTYDVTQGTVYNRFTLVNDYLNTRVNTVSVTGLPQYAISPIFFTNTLIGYPTQFVTGPVPAYYVSGAMGNTGDTVSVSGDTYFFFNAGAFGLLMKTT